MDTSKGRATDAVDASVLVAEDAEVVSAGNLSLAFRLRYGGTRAETVGLAPAHVQERTCVWRREMGYTYCIATLPPDSQ